MVIQPPDPEQHERTVYAGFDPAGVGSGTRSGHVPETATDAVAAVPLYDNIHVLARLSNGEDRNDLLERARAMVKADPDTLDPFDLPERDRMYALAVQFVSNHVRQVRSGDALKVRDHFFGDDTLVVSEKPFPNFPLRLVKVNWAIDRGSVTDVHGHRVLCSRLRPLRIPPRRFIWTAGKGDIFDVPYLLGNLCAILDVHVPTRVAATGVIADGTNQILGKSLLEQGRAAAAHDGMSHLILPFGSHLMPGEHQGVRYWPARDVNEAIYSLLAAASSDVAIPDLKRRWRVKMTYSWVSLLAVLLAIGAIELAGAAGGFVGNPLVLRWTLGVGVVLLAMCMVATHRYRRIDR